MVPHYSSRSARTVIREFMGSASTLEAAWRPLSVVLTLWLSSTAAVVEASRPTRSRSAMTDEVLIGAQEQAGIAPAAEVAEHRALRWQVVGQKPPCDIAAQDVEDAVKDLAHRPQRRSSALGRAFWMELGEALCLS